MSPSNNGCNVGPGIQRPVINTYKIRDINIEDTYFPGVMKFSTAGNLTYVQDSSCLATNVDYIIPRVTTPFLYDNELLIYPTEPSRIGSDFSPQATSEIPSNIQFKNGSFSGACLSVHDFNVIPVVTANIYSSGSSEYSDLDFTEMKLDEFGQLIFRDEIVNRDTGIVLMDEATVVVSEPFWLGIQCESHRVFRDGEQQLWFTIPFRKFPRWGGVTEFQYTSSELSSEYFVGVIGMGALFVFVAAILLCYLPTKSFLKCVRESKVDISERKNANGFDNREEVLELISKLKKEKTSIETLIEPPSTVVKRKMCCSVTWVSGVFAVCFFFLLVVAGVFVQATDVVGDAKSSFIEVSNSSTSLHQTLNLYQFRMSEIYENGTACTGLTEELFYLINDTLTESSIVSQNLLGYTNVTNNAFVDAMEAVRTRDTVVLVIFIVYTISLASSPLLLLFASCLTCFTFRYKRNILCKTTSHRVWNALEPTIIVTVITSWTVAGVVTMYYTLLVDICWNPSVLYTSDIRTNITVPENFIYETPYGKTFNPADFFVTCSYKIDTNTDLYEQFNYFLPLLKELGASTLLLQNATSSFSLENCPAYFEGNTSILLNHSKAMANHASKMIACEEYGAHLSTILFSTCGKSTGSALIAFFALIVSILAIAISLHVVYYHRTPYMPNLVKFGKAEKQHRELSQERQLLVECYTNYENGRQDTDVNEEHLSMQALQMEST